MNESFKLLIVDDEPLARQRILSFDLAKYGLEAVGEAGDGNEALTMARRLGPDIVVTDINMPVMDGLQLLEELQKFDIPPKVVILTCYDDFNKAQSALRLGAQDYIVKVLLKENEFAATMSKVTRLIIRERQALYKTIRKTLYDFMLCARKENQAGYMSQLDEYTFKPVFYSLALIEFTPDSTQTETVNELSVERWEGEYRSVVVNSTACQWVLFLYSAGDAPLEAFNLWRHAYCTEIAGALIEVQRSDTNNCYAMLSPVYAGIRTLPQAYSVLMTMREQAFYRNNGKLVYVDDDVMLELASMPDDHFQGILDRMREFLSAQNGKGTAGCLAEWMDCVDMKYMPRPSEVRIMASLLASCIPAGIHIPYKTDAAYPLRLWLKEQVESARHMTDIRSAMAQASELMYQEMGDANPMRSEIKSALDYIHHNYKKDINFDTVAHHVNLSASWFGTLFRTGTGESFSEYLTSYRLKKAQRLLIDTDMTISSIAQEVGIQDPHYFSRLFTKITGCNPKDFRSRK